MATTRRARNWTNVALASATCDGITAVSFALNKNVLQESADMDQYPTHTVNTFTNPSATVTSQNAMGWYAVAQGLVGIFTATLADSKLLAASGSGAVVFTSNALCLLDDYVISGNYNQLATFQTTVRSSSVDGVTSPFSTAVL